MFPFFFNPAPIASVRNFNDIRTAGQKEDIFEDSIQQHAQLQQAPIPAGKFMESSSIRPSTNDEDDDPSGPSDPIAHAIVSPAKSERHHDSLADIYLTGNA